jgi:hypothetical protein
MSPSSPYAQERAEAEARKRTEQLEQERQAFLQSAVGMARTAFDRGDLIFHHSVDVINQRAIIVAMVGSVAKRPIVSASGPFRAH